MLTEDTFYEAVSAEMENDKIQKGSWTKAFVESGGNENSTKSHYIRLRAQELLAAAYSNVPRPWRRFWAKKLDLLLFAVVVATVLKACDVHIDTTDWSNLWWGILFLFVFAIYDAVILASIGTTPAKFAFGISVQTPHGKLTFGQALARNFEIWFYGFACGIPILSLISMAAAYDRMGKGNPASWDENGRASGISYSSPTIVRSLIGIALFIGAISILTLSQAKSFGNNTSLQTAAITRQSQAMTSPNLAQQTIEAPVSASTPKRTQAEEGEYQYLKATLFDGKNNDQALNEWCASLTKRSSQVKTPEEIMDYNKERNAYLRHLYSR